MTISHVVRTVPEGPAVVAVQETVRIYGRRITSVRPAVAVVRSMVAVALAALAILVLLPAAIAAQAASTI